MACWFLLWIALFDFGASKVLRPPSDPRIEPGKLQRYLEYGRSVEGKLRTMVKADDEHTAALARVGWLATPLLEPQLVRSTHAGKVLVAAYGQSFTQHILRAAVESDPRFELRMLGGPASPLSHSFKLYQNDRSQHHADLVVIGVLASTLAQLATMTTMTWAFEAPAPYTYPRYAFRAGRLEETPPSLTSLAGLRSALSDAARWRAFRDQLEAHDAAFDAWVFDAGLLDRSALGRLCRRALGQRKQRRFTARFLDAGGFTNAEGILDVAAALLAEFARSAREDGRVPFVLLFNDRGYGDHLYRALGPRLRALEVPFLSSHEFAPASDPQTFLPDGHFRADLDRRMADAWLAQARDLTGKDRHAPRSTTLAE